MEGGFGRYVLPGIILQSVLIGGGYATGREIVEYGARFGAMGWLGGIGVFIGFVLIAFLTFEFARKFQVFDYRSLLQQLIGRAWFLYDIVYLAMAILVIAVVSSAAGEILKNTLEMNYLLGVSGIIMLVALLNFYGEWLIERFKSYVTAALIIAYVVFGAVVISATWDNTTRVFAEWDTSYADGGSGLGLVLWTGILYVGYNLAVFPASFFTLRRHYRRRHTLVAGLIAGLLMCVPWFFTYFALMGFYPSEEVMGAEVPWLVMLGEFGGWYLAAFGIVVGFTLIETATGMIHAFINRLDTHLRQTRGASLTKVQSGGIAVIGLGLALLLAQVGIIELIARGYLAIAYALIAIYAIPLLTVGIYRIFFEPEPEADKSEFRNQEL